MANWINILEVLYPVGSIYLSKNSTSPASIIGGSWTQIQGAVLGAIGESISNGYGGDKTISIDQMPKHKHSVKWSNNPDDEKETDFTNQDYPARHSVSGNTQRFVAAVGDKIKAMGLVVLPEGGGQEYMPYHFGVYIWYRTT